MRAVGTVASTVGVDAIHEVVVVIPVVILLFYGAVHEGRIGLGGAGLLAKCAGREKFGDVLVALVVRDEAAGGERFLGRPVERLSRGEEIDEREAVFLRDGSDGGGVEGEVGVFFFAVGQVTFRGLIFEGDRRDEHDAGCGRAVVGFAQRVLDPSRELGFEIGDLGRAVERFVVAEEREEGVGLEVGEPLVRRGEEALAFVDFEAGIKFLRAGEGPLRRARGMRTEAGCVADMTQIAEKQIVLRVTQGQLRLDAVVVNIALGEAVADENDALALARRRDDLRTRGGGGGRFGFHAVGRIDGLRRRRGPRLLARFLLGGVLGLGGRRSVGFYLGLGCDDGCRRDDGSGFLRLFGFRFRVWGRWRWRTGSGNRAREAGVGRGFDGRDVAAVAERARFVGADERHVEIGFDGGLQAQRPERCVHQHATVAVVEEILGGTVKRGEDAAGFAGGAFISAGPLGGHRRLGGVGRGIGSHAVERLGHGENLAVGGFAHVAALVGPDGFHAAQNRMGGERGDDVDAGALRVVLAVVADP